MELYGPSATRNYVGILDVFANLCQENVLNKAKYALYSSYSLENYVIRAILALILHN